MLRFRDLNAVMDEDGGQGLDHVGKQCKKNV
jgi:hypothetical protein